MANATVGQPLVTVIVASQADRPVAEGHLCALAARCAAADAELVVVRADTPQSVRALQSAHPHAKFLAIPTADGAQALRLFGIQEANGDVVLLLDDDHPIDLARVDEILQNFRVARFALEHDANVARPAAIAPLPVASPKAVVASAR